MPSVSPSAASAWLYTAMRKILSASMAALPSVISTFLTTISGPTSFVYLFSKNTCVKSSVLTSASAVSSVASTSFSVAVPLRPTFTVPVLQV